MARQSRGRAFDYVIVGAGSAGCLLADRLTAEGATRVLLLEAGGRDTDPLIHIPLGLGRLHATRAHDWGYDSEPEPELNGRSIEAMRGKVLGGSSSINHMSHSRGNPGDYDRWAERGLPEWSYRIVLPYFRRYEHWQNGADDYRGGEGPLSVTYSSAKDPLFDAFVTAAERSGYRFTADINGAQQTGIGRSQTTIRHGRRHSAAVAFLHPAERRETLTVETDAHATRLLFDGNRAVGVEYRRGGELRRVTAEREVLVCAGVFNTPQLLMLSGIGPAEHLAAHGIVPLVDLPGVGQNLQDHLAVTVAAARPIPGPFRREMRADRMAFSLVRALVFGSGPASSLPSGLHAYVKLAPNAAVPDIQLMFVAVPRDAHLWFPAIRRPYPDACGVRAVLLHPRSRGRVELRSAHPFERVRIFQNFLAHADDLPTLRAGVRVARELLHHPALAPFRGEELQPGAGARSDAAIDAWIRASAITSHHPSGTCAMGIDGDAVVDAELRVRGTQRLRVVDASVMPDLVSGNINACVLMIAEKASDLIRGRPLLAPSPAAAPPAESPALR